MFLGMRNISSLFFCYITNMIAYKDGWVHCFFNKGTKTLSHGWLISINILGLLTDLNLLSSFEFRETFPDDKYTNHSLK